MKRAAHIFAFALLAAGLSFAQTDDLGVHEMSATSGGNVYGLQGGGCRFCHAPHNGMGKPALWNQTLTTAQYTGLYSSRYGNVAKQPALGSDSNLCLSCHDGTVAVGLSVAYGQIPTGGPGMDPAFVEGTDLSSSHPFSLQTPIKNTDYTTPLLSQGQTNDPEVPLPNGTVECTSCHNPHKQFVDPNGYYLIVNNSDITPDRLCNACHGDMSSSGATVAANTTSLPPTISTAAYSKRYATAELASDAGPRVVLQASHATSAFRRLGAPDTSGQSHASRTKRTGSACQTCHTNHGGQTGKSLLGSSEQEMCLSCHSAGGRGAPAARDIGTQIAKGGHIDADHQHRTAVAESKSGDRPQHAACSDCHDSHTARRVDSFTPAPIIRVSQGNVPGVSATDGTTALARASAQYETCFRCHTKTQADPAGISKFGYMPVRTVDAAPQNFVLAFAASASSHPVTHTRSSSYPQPSLRPVMTLLDGAERGRAMGSQIFCTDCHNSDDNREFGGNGATGPHGSKFSHILERRYEFNQAAVAGQVVSNLMPNPDLGPAGPYALCAKCHDLKQVTSDNTFRQHSRHINAGFSCSVCHTAHGVSRSAGSDRLVSFDLRVVAGVTGAPPAYNRQTQTCSLTCHGHAHSAL